MHITAEELEAKLAFELNKIEAARIILDASYKAGEEGQETQVSRLLRCAADELLQLEEWQVDCPTPLLPSPIPWMRED